MLFRSPRLFLFVDAAENPVNRQGAGPESQGDMSIFEATGRELKAGVETVGV